MELNDYIQIVCPDCKALLFAEKNLDLWYCGHCGRKIEITHEDEKKEDEKKVPVLTGDIFLCDKDTLVKYAGKDEDVDIPDYITKISSGAFKGNTSLRTVTIPDSVKEIGDSVFEGCTSLTDIQLPSEIRKIEYKTFSDCDSLKKIVIPAMVDEISYNAMCCGLEEIVFESSYTTWEPENDYTNPSFEVARNGSSSGVSRIYFRGVSYSAAELYRYKSVAAYLKAEGLCQNCGGKFGVFGKCKTCGTKKEK